MADDLSAFVGDTDTTESSVPELQGQETSTAADTLAADMAGEGHESGSSDPSSSSEQEWTKQLPKEIRENAESLKRLSGFKNVSDLVQAYLKSDGVDFSDVKKVMEKLGAPKEGEKYDWEDNLKDDMKSFSTTARKANLTKEQAKTVMEGYALLDEARVQTNIAKVKAAVPKIASDLKAEFGDDALTWHRNAVKNTGLNGVLAKNGLSANATIARALVLLGREMTEDYTPSGSSGGKSKGKSLLEGATFDY
jgi:hypothetical protein